MIIITKWQSTKKWSTPSIYWVIKGQCWWSDLRGRSVGRQHVTSSHVLALLSNPHLGSMELWDLADTAALISMPLCCFMRARNNFIVPCHVIVYRGAGTMAPSVDKSVVVLCRDDVGLWAPRRQLCSEPFLIWAVPSPVFPSMNPREQSEPPCPK